MKKKGGEGRSKRRTGATKNSGCSTSTLTRALYPVCSGKGGDLWGTDSRCGAPHACLTDPQNIGFY